MNRRFESDAKLVAIPDTVTAEIIFTSAPYILFQQFQLDNNFCTHLETMLISNRALRTGIKPTPHQKSYEKNTGFQSFVVHCRGANKQIFLLSISLVYDKSDQHNTMFDSYNIEVATNKIRSITLENAANTCSVFNGIKLDLDDDRNKFLLHRQFVSWVCVGCSIASFTDYSNNEVAIELPNAKK